MTERPWTTWQPDAETERAGLEREKGPEIVVNGRTVGYGMEGMAAALPAMLTASSYRPPHGGRPSSWCEMCQREAPPEGCPGCGDAP